MKTQDKVWFITGASKGLGLAFVKMLLAAGNKVAATSRNAQDITEQFDSSQQNLLALTTDITDESSVNAAVAATLDRFGKIDVVVNNAGYLLINWLRRSSR